MQVPDLENGFIILNYDTDNRWVTRVEASLKRERPGGVSEYAYLSHECRAENVGEDPFGHGDAFFLGISTWSGNFLMGGGSSILKKSPKYQTRRTERRYLVSCEDRAVRPLTFDEVLSNVQDDCRRGYNQIFSEVSYTYLGARYSICTPCRYLNFPPRELEGKGYLQPISGHVLFEEEERFYLAYVVAYVEEGVTKSIQFRVVEQTDVFRTVPGLGRRRKLLASLLRKLPTLLYTTGYERVVRMPDADLQCRFYQYR
jgi:hypothetical protein